MKTAWYANRASLERSGAQMALIQSLTTLRKFSGSTANPVPEKRDDTKLLKEIRDNYSYFAEAWESIRTEAKRDMRYVAGDPWNSNEREFRVKHDRPVMSWDELSPYIDRLVNSIKQNKRAIKFNPKGYGANEQTAKLRENHVREIQYNSRSQAAFSTAFQGAVERSYGFFGIGARLVVDGLSDEQYIEMVKSAPERLFEQELYIYRIPNPDSVLFNPNYKLPDFSDSTECFVEDVLQRSEFKRRYPKAQFGDWSESYLEMTPGDSGWQKQKEVRVAAYWKVLIKKRKLYLLDADTKPVAMYEDELDEKPERWLADEKNNKRISRDRIVETKTVKQCVTNGLEILEENGPYPIPQIPILGITGKELWVDEGSGAKRKLISLVRMARDPFMAYCYIRSQEAEEAGMAPKAPVIGYTGQFVTDKDAWDTVNKIPRAYLQVDPVSDPNNPNQVLPLPERPQFVPNFQSYEVFAEAARRQIQTTMGGSNLPTAAQRKNEKSGVALKEIDQDEDRGTFHFIDNFDFTMEGAGRVIDAWYASIYDTKREITWQEPDQSRKTVTINDPNFQEKDKNGNMQPAHYDATAGAHSVTVTVGPDFNSERDEASDFVDTLVSELQAIAAIVPPGAAAKILALSIRLKQLGPLGDEMADTIDPPADEKQRQAQMGQLQNAAQQQQQVIQELQAELQKLQLEKAGKVIQGEYQKAIQQMQNDIKVLVALITAKNDRATQELEMYQTFVKENHGAAHEAAMQAVQHAHERDMATAQQAHETSQAALAQASGGEGPVNPSQESTQ